MGSSLVLRVVLAFLIFPFMAYEGIDRGRKYGAVEESQAQLMVVTSVTNANGRLLFPAFEATGTLPSGEIQRVKVFKREYEELRLGEKIAVLAVDSPDEPYITVSRLKESKPFVRLGAIAFSWHFPVAVVGWLVLGFYLVKVWLNARRTSEA